MPRLWAKDDRIPDWHRDVQRLRPTLQPAGVARPDPVAGGRPVVLRGEFRPMTCNRRVSAVGSPPARRSIQARTATKADRCAARAANRAHPAKELPAWVLCPDALCGRRAALLSASIQKSHPDETEEPMGLWKPVALHSAAPPMWVTPAPTAEHCLGRETSREQVAGLSGPAAGRPQAPTPQAEVHEPFPCGSMSRNPVRWQRAPRLGSRSRRSRTPAKAERLASVPPAVGAERR